jgi:hypothetical protein
MSTHIAYLAGFFDGEGCVGIYVRSNGYTVLKAVTDQRFNSKPLEMLHDQFGGNFWQQPNGLWRHELNGLKVCAMMEELLPYLVVKHDQAELVMRYGAMTSTEKKEAGVMLKLMKRQEGT